MAAKALHHGAAGELLPDRAGLRLGRRCAAYPRDARWRSLCAQRPEAVHLRCRRRRPLCRDGADRRRRAWRHLDPGHSGRDAGRLVRRQRAQDGLERAADPRGDFRECPRAGRQPSGRGGDRLQDRDGRARRRPHQYRSMLARRCAERARQIAGLHEGAQSLWKAPRRIPGAAVSAGRHGDRTGGGADVCLARGGRARSQGCRRHHAVRDGQTFWNRCRVRGRQPGAAVARRLRLPQRIRHREDRARSARAPDSGRDQRNHAADRVAQADRGRAMTDVAVAEGDLIARKEGSAGILRLNRPKAINAVTLEMFHDVDKALDAFEADPDVAVIILEGAGERGLCAGGDIRALWESSKVKGDLGKILWRDEYILNARIKKFPKPYVAFMDGIVMGGGVGLSTHSSHRVVTEKTKLAMPEVGLGFFPDVGGTWLLSHSPGEIGTYFGLTGQTMNGPDAIHAKFADAVVSSSKLPALREALTKVASGATSADVRKLIDGFSTGETVGPVAAMQAKIDALFSHDRMEDIVGALQRDGSDFAQATLKTLNEKSPRGMVVTLKLLRLARTSKSLEVCLVREYRAALEVFASDDFREGVRAAVIDKDRNPKWSPTRIEDVTPAMVAPYFAEIGADELKFP